MRLQLWSYNYDPEPLGIGPVSSVWAKAMTERGHHVEVVAAHPHYPEAKWGRKLVPYREVRDGIRVTRLPLMVGRVTKRQRLAQEVSFLASQTAASPFVGTPDVLIAVSPSFPALLPAMLISKVKSIPWVLWLQDILPDGAVATGYMDEQGMAYRLSRRLEGASYRSANGIALLSDSFRANLRTKGVPESKISVVYNPATLPVQRRYLEGVSRAEPPRIVCIGNIGRSQGLDGIVRDFEANDDLERIGARLVITGSGVAEDEVRAAITTDRVEMTGLLSRENLQAELGRATLAAVTQAYDTDDFNVPSKLMNYLAVGLPVVASVRSTSEAARIINASGGGWVSNRGNAESFSATVADALLDTDELSRRSEAGFRFAESNLTPEALALNFEAILETAIENR